MLTMYDSVTVTDIPKEPAAVAAYINGIYKNIDEVRARFPRARILTISVTGDVVADCYDIEHGDYKASDVERLYHIAHDAGVWRPCFYAQLSGVMPQVKDELNKIPGLVREDVRLWVAYYNGLPDLPVTYDAHQFTDHALGRNLDESICSDTFFPPASSPSDVDEYKASTTVFVSFDSKTRQFSVS